MLLWVHVTAAADDCGLRPPRRILAAHTELRGTDCCEAHVGCRGAPFARLRKARACGRLRLPSECGAPAASWPQLRLLWASAAWTPRWTLPASRADGVRLKRCVWAVAPCAAGGIGRVSGPKSCCGTRLCPDRAVGPRVATAPRLHLPPPQTEQEFWFAPEDIEGEIPRDLRGTFFRNGPGISEVYGHKVRSAPRAAPAGFGWRLRAPPTRASPVDYPVSS